MRKSLLLELIVLISVMTAAARGPPGLPFNVYGYVLDETGAPIADAYVTVNSTVDQKTTRTDSLGRYVATISISGAGDTLTVVAEIGEASGTSSSTVPKGSPNMMINVTVPLGQGKVTSTTKTVPSTPTEAGPLSFFVPVAFFVVALAALILVARRVLSRR